MIVNIVGVRSQGKSTLGLYMSRPEEFDAAIVLDPRSQFPLRGAEVYEYLEGEQNLLDALSTSEVQRFVVRPAGNLEDASTMLGHDVAEILAVNPKLRLAVILDESGNEAMKKILNRDPWDRLFRTHPRKTTYFFLCCHRPTDTPTNVRALIDWWACFRVNMVDDLEMMRKQCGERYAAELATLEPREWLLYDTTQSNESDRIIEFKDPDVWYVPLDPPSVVRSERP